MLQVYGFERIGVALSDLYFVDPNPAKGQEGAEHGVRLEVRLLEKQPLDGSIYASRPILVGAPVWRADLLESVAGKPGSFDRTHHHPTMRGWEPGSRKFERDLSADPLGWLERAVSATSTRCSTRPACHPTTCTPTTRRSSRPRRRRSRQRPGAYSSGCAPASWRPPPTRRRRARA